MFSPTTNLIYTSRDFHPVFLSKCPDKTFHYVGPAIHRRALSKDDMLLKKSEMFETKIQICYLHKSGYTIGLKDLDWRTQAIFGP
eukprot:UN17512